MNPLNEPQPSIELQILDSLHPRMKLTNKEILRLDQLTKGYEGEKKFYHLLMENLPPKPLLISDLLLKNNQSEFQMDSILLNNNPIYLFDVKNFEGNYYIRDDKWYNAATGKEIRNPIHQLQRCQLLLRQYLQQFGYNLPIKSYAVFVNEEFTLYQAPLDIPAIFPTQLKRLMYKLHQSSLTPTRRHIDISKKLISNHIKESSNQQLPEYEYNQLKKGIICDTCGGFLAKFNRNTLTCTSCGQPEDVEDAVIRNVEELILLFPKKKITTSIVHEWCGEIISDKAIRRILSKRLRMVANGIYTYYVFPEEKNKFT